MLSQSKVSIQAASKTLLDILLLGVGVLGGGVVMLLGLWLWLDYRTNPSRSLLALVSVNLAALLPSPWLDFMAREAQLMGLPLAGQSPAYWYVARAGGIVAYLLLWLSVVWGLALSTKITDKWVSPLLAFGLHEFLSLSAVTFAALHALVLLGDSYIGFNLFHLAIPFSAPYEPAWTGLGTLGFYLSLALTSSFYLRQQIGPKAWRTLHYCAFAAYGLSLVHGWLAGSDSDLALIKGMYWLTGGGVLFLTYYRLFTLKIKRTKLAQD